MRRYMFITLGIGAAAALFTLALYFLGAFEPANVFLDRIYQGNGFYPTDTPVVRLKWLEVLIIVSLSIWISWCLADLNQAGQKIIVLGVFFFIVLGISPTLALYGRFYDPFSSLSALILSASAAIVFSGTELGRRKRILETVLGRRISRGLFSKLMEAPSSPVFSGEKREVSVLTCRIVNRAELAGGMKPSDFLRLTNLFRRTVSHFLISRGAYLDEAGPELIRAYFGLIPRDSDHSVSACRAALRLRQKFRPIQDECRTRWSHVPVLGIGVSSSEVVNGVYGSKEHFFLSAIGPAADFSRRLSRGGALYGAELCIGPETYRLANGAVEVRPLDLFYDPETNSMMEIYQLLDTREGLGADARELRDQFWEGVIHYRKENYAGAIEAFGKARVPGTEDGPVDYFIGKCREKLEAASGKEESLPGEGYSRLLEQL